MSTPNKETVNINLSRMELMRKMFCLSRKDLVAEINKSRKKFLFTEEDVFTNEIDVKVLTKVDKIFGRGLTFYLNPNDYQESSELVTYFRKTNTKKKLSIADSQAILKIIQKMSHINWLAKSANYQHEIKLPRFQVRTTDPEQAAASLRDLLIPKSKQITTNQFLRKFKDNISALGILVLEYAEPAKKSKKTNLDGFFLAPNCIAVKKRSRNPERQAFTLAHEIGHVVTGKDSSTHSPEIIDKQEEDCETEKWCNRFAFALLVPQDELEGLTYDDQDRINYLFEKYHVNKLAIYKYLNIIGELSDERYSLLHNQAIEDDEEASKASGSSPRTMAYTFEKAVYRHAFLSGLVDDTDVYKQLGIKNLDKFIDS